MPPALAAVLMSASTIVVALNAQLLRRVELRPPALEDHPTDDMPPAVVHAGSHSVKSHDGHSSQPNRALPLSLALSCVGQMPLLYALPSHVGVALAWATALTPDLVPA